MRKAYKMLYNLKNLAIQEKKVLTKITKAELSKTPPKNLKIDHRSKTPLKLTSKSGYAQTLISQNSKRMVDSLTFNHVLDAVSRVI